MFAQGNDCFIVRVSTPTGDDNQNELCTEQEPFVFTGISAMERQLDGGYQLEWPLIPADGIIYSIYEANETTPYDFELPSFDAITDDFYKIDPPERGPSTCYVVRYFAVGLPLDENTTELCTEEETPIEFAGVKNIEALSPTSVRVTWDLSPDDFVTAYRIYDGSDFKELVTEVEATESSAVIEGRVPERQYSFGVRAVDQFDRADKNLTSRSIIMPASP